ncbi:porin [Burkholderia sp. SG-MS1]|uniref:porin n=1 Tax=Paraburkholderia sp. SG-MS1 TaxID=2023741 RepID=UPI001446DF1C|nr:porin [Paraburkholderia sp. SG-MS1]NKJ49135.1 porin [Paraburkholderia sp. SG-MS1]
MKNKLLISVAALAIMGTAHAQSTVTLYGLADAGFVFNNNSGGSQLYSLASGNQQGSRWGLRGREDLGGGLKTIFVLENGFSVVNGKLGQGNDEFGRQAYVGIGSDRIGTLTLGRQYDMVVDYLGRFESGTQWATGYGAHPGDLDNLDNNNRVNNALKFHSQTYAGFSAGALYSLGGVAGDATRNQIWSLGADYNNGPLSLAAAYLNVRDPNYSFFGNNSSSSTTGSNMTSLVYSGYASAKTQQVIAAAGAYALGRSTFGATYSNTQFKNIGAETGLAATGRGGSAKFHNVEANYRYQVTPALVLGVAWDYTHGYGVNDATYQQVNLGADYFLSKRTDIYLVGLYQHASGTDSTGHAARANLNQLTASTTSNQTAAIAGIRMKF